MPIVDTILSGIRVCGLPSISEASNLWNISLNAAARVPMPPLHCGVNHPMGTMLLAGASFGWAASHSREHVP
jgi:hypothetical protein